jgi:flavin-binding protein dodecin
LRGSAQYETLTAAWIRLGLGAAGRPKGLEGRLAAVVAGAQRAQRSISMADSVYKVIELIGTSTESWEKAAANAIERAAGTLRELRVAEVVELDLNLEDGKVQSYRARVKVSFKYEPD